MATVRVVQISDTHLGGDAHMVNVTPEEGLAATVRAAVSQRPDLVLLTGDIADGGSPESYRVAVSLLAPLAAPVLAIAGNHDDPQPLRAQFGGEHERMVGEWRIVMVPTFVDGEIHGHVDVDGLLRRLGPDRGRPTLLAMHHPPISTSTHAWFELLDGAELVSALSERTDVRLVLSGHLHDTFRVVCGGVTYAGCPSTWYSLEHVGDQYRRDDGEVGALRADLYPDGRFELATVRRESSAPVAAGSVAASGMPRVIAAPAPPRTAPDVRLFDRYVMVSWSAASRPTRGESSIWRATMRAESGQLDCVDHPTRSDAIAALIDELLGAADERVFVGVDFPLGYPEGFAGRLARTGANWRTVWAAITEEIEDGPTNENNRFHAADRLNTRAGMSPGPFWGCPVDEATGSLGSTRPATFFGLSEYRLTDRRTAERTAGAGNQRSVWQLFGTDDLGSRSLLGIPMLRRLSEHPTLGRRLRIWPFDTGIDPLPTRGGPGTIVVAETRGALLDLDLDQNTLREAAEATGVCRRLAQLDAAENLGALFSPTLTADEAKTVEREEGWIIGA